MNKKKFEHWMNSIDDTYLEEAAVPMKKKNYRYFAMAAAACLVLAATGLLLRQGLLPDTQSPNEPPEISGEPDTCELITKQFTKYDEIKNEDIEYTILSHIVAEPADLSGMEAADAEPLVWVVDGLEIKLCSTNDMAWASWYDANQGTQWCLKANTSTLSLLTTAMDIVQDLGYNVNVAPADAVNITYNAFLLNGLTVAETSFVIEDIRYSFRMAATSEIAEDFADISGTGTEYDMQTASEVGWCPAKLYFNENGEGKIIWFDIVPGLLYSLSMETNASEEALLTMAHELFSPAQDAANW
ncbi:MAG: hypothetical protein J6J44_10325 [Lachnospiraceae bacterium]|nr:hypothetical protein [Lachnospiraceae bacterium]